MCTASLRPHSKLSSSPLPGEHPKKSADDVPVNTLMFSHKQSYTAWLSLAVILRFGVLSRLLVVDFDEKDEKEAKDCGTGHRRRSRSTKLSRRVFPTLFSNAHSLSSPQAPLFSPQSRTSKRNRMMKKADETDVPRCLSSFCLTRLIRYHVVRMPRSHWPTAQRTTSRVSTPR